MTPDEILERTQWDFWWAPPDVTVVDRPEVMYACCPRDKHFLNAVTRTRAPASQLPALADEVMAAHKGVQSRWLVCPQNNTPDLESILVERSYAPGPDHVATTVLVEDYEPRPAARISVRQVESLERLRDCMAVGYRAFGHDPDVTDDELQQQLDECANPDGRVHRFVAYDDASGEPISSGGINIFPDLSFGFLWAGGTVPAERGRGAYSAIIAARVALARRKGIDRVGLYAKWDTSAPVVVKQGFDQHGLMNYWDRLPG